MKKIIQYKTIKEHKFEETYYQISMIGFWVAIVFAFIFGFLLVNIISVNSMDREIGRLKVELVMQKNVSSNTIASFNESLNVALNAQKETMQGKYYDCRNDLWQCNQQVNKCIEVK